MKKLLFGILLSLFIFIGGYGVYGESLPYSKEFEGTWIEISGQPDSIVQRLIFAEGQIGTSLPFYDTLKSIRPRYSMAPGSKGSEGKDISFILSRIQEDSRIALFDFTLRDLYEYNILEVEYILVKGDLALERSKRLFYRKTTRK